MPLVRYELRSEYSIANPELFKTAPKSDAEALFESITMAALAGIVRQVGELSELAAEVFNGLHEEVMALSARGRKLSARVKQLEAEVLAVEQFTFSELDQLCFAFTRGLDWHSSICFDENHFTKPELPHFIQKSYEESRGPPRFFLLDSFDTAGPGACLKRYSDPSFFRTKWAKSELLKAEKAHNDKRVRKAKKEKHDQSRTTHEASSTEVNARSLKASKFIHSVDTFTDPYLEIDTDRMHMGEPAFSQYNGEQDLPKSLETLRISATEIEAGALFRKTRYTSVSDSDPVTSADSPDQFVDALTTMEPETEQDVSKLRDNGPEASENNKSSRGSSYVDSQDGVANGFESVKDNDANIIMPEKAQDIINTPASNDQAQVLLSNTKKGHLPLVHGLASEVGFDSGHSSDLQLFLDISQRMERPAEKCQVDNRQESSSSPYMCQAFTEKTFYSSTSSSEISLPSDVPEQSPSSPSQLSDDSSPHHIFSALDSPMSHVGTSDVAPLKQTDYLSIKMSPGSPTLGPNPFCASPTVEQQAPSPPPLPPIKWRIMKTPTSSPVPATVVESAPALSPAPVAPTKTKNGDAPQSGLYGGEVVHELLLDSIVSHDKDNLRKVSNHARARSLDSRDVLLEQIRTRSFNLKHAVQEKSDTPRSTPSINVSAILEKATAIRQALEGSDDDEDWIE